MAGWSHEDSGAVCREHSLLNSRQKCDCYFLLFLKLVSITEQVFLTLTYRYILWCSYVYLFHWWHSASEFSQLNEPLACLYSKCFCGTHTTCVLRLSVHSYVEARHTGLSTQISGPEKHPCCSQVPPIHGMIAA